MERTIVQLPGAQVVGDAIADLSPVSQDACYRCGYALRGIDNDQPCPECGLLAERSRHVTDELHDTRPQWLGRLALGTKLLVLALIIGGAWPIVVGPLQLAIYRYTGQTGKLPWWAEPLGYQVVPFAGFDATAVLLVAGVWMLTARERYAPADERDRHRRIALRVLTIVFIGSIITLHIVIHWMVRTMFTGRPALRIETMWLIFWSLFTMAMVPMPFLLFRQLRSLANRARSAHLAEHCSIVGVGASCSIAYFLLVGLTYTYPVELGLPENWTTRSQVSLALMLAGSVAALLFLLWSIYLLVRFTVSFHIAARLMRTKWDRDDRSIAVDEVPAR